MAVGKNIRGKKGKQYHLFDNIEAVEKNIKWGRGRTFWGRLSRIKNMGVGKNIRLQGSFA